MATRSSFPATSSVSWNTCRHFHDHQGWPHGRDRNARAPWEIAASAGRDPYSLSLEDLFLSIWREPMSGFAGTAGCDSLRAEAGPSDPADLGRRAIGWIAMEVISYKRTFTGRRPSSTRFCRERCRKSGDGRDFRSDRRHSHAGQGDHLGQPSDHLGGQWRLRDVQRGSPHQGRGGGRPDRASLLAYGSGRLAPLAAVPTVTLAAAGPGLGRLYVAVFAAEVSRSGRRPCCRFPSSASGP